MNIENKEKIQKLKDSFINFLKENKRKDSDLFDDFKKMELNELLDELKDKLYYYQQCPTIYITKAIDEFDLERTNVDVMIKLESYFKMFNKIIDILYY